VSGFGVVTRVKATTIIGAVGKNLFLLGATNGTTSSFGELAPVPQPRDVHTEPEAGSFDVVRQALGYDRGPARCSHAGLGGAE
jgi:hypothetical protein